MDLGGARTFWARAPWLTRLALLAAIVSACANVITFVTVDPAALSPGIVVGGVLTFVASCWTFLVWYRYEQLAIKLGLAADFRGPNAFPRWLKIAAVLAAIYGLAALLWSGSPEETHRVTTTDFGTLEARRLTALFSGFALMAAWAGHVITERTASVQQSADAGVSVMGWRELIVDWPWRSLAVIGLVACLGELLVAGGGSARSVGGAVVIGSLATIPLRFAHVFARRAFGTPVALAVAAFLVTEVLAVIARMTWPTANRVHDVMRFIQFGFFVGLFVVVVWTFIHTMRRASGR